MIVMKSVVGWIPIGFLFFLPVKRIKTHVDKYFLFESNINALSSYTFRIGLYTFPLAFSVLSLLLVYFYLLFTYLIKLRDIWLMVSPFPRTRSNLEIWNTNRKRPGMCFRKGHCHFMVGKLQHWIICMPLHLMKEKISILRWYSYSW